MQTLRHIAPRTRWILGFVLLAVALRSPFLVTPLHLDESGLALIGQSLIQGEGHGRSLYGNLWIDRSPLLILIYGAAQTVAGAVGVRMIGLLSAIAVIVISGRIAITLGYSGAVPWVCGIAALLTSTPALGADLAYPELLAAALVAGSAWCCCSELVGPHRRAPRTGIWLLAGMLAVAALLTKQSFLDGLALTGVAAIIGRPQWHRLRTVLPWAVGVALPLGAVGIWAVTFGSGISPLMYAMFGFRIDGAAALANSATPMSQRFMLLGFGLLAAGIPALLPWILALVRTMYRRRERLIALLFATWLSAGLIGVLGGGYYWTHYIIQLIPVVAVAAGVQLAVTKRTRLRQLTIVTVVLLVVGCSLGQYHRGLLAVGQNSTMAAAHVLQSNRHANDTLFVMYAHVNLVYYSKMTPAFPYQWSLMYRTIPGIQRRAQAMIASPQRPTWVVEWQHPTSFGLDQGATTARLIAQYYRPIDNACGHTILLRRDDPRIVHPAEVDTSFACTG